MLNKKILITRALHQVSEFADKLSHLGADILEFPTIEIKAPESFVPLDDAIKNIGVYDLLLFTSTNSVDVFCERLQKGGKDARALGHLKIGAVGPSTAKRLKKHGFAS